MILNASAAKGASSEALRSSVAPVSGLMPVTGGMSSIVRRPGGAASTRGMAFTTIAAVATGSVSRSGFEERL